MLIAVTGGIGVGKSTIIDELKKLGAHAIKTDEINRELLKDSTYIDELSKAFPSVVLPNGSIDKLKLKELIFNDESLRLKLNSLAHPLIINKIIEQSNKYDILFVEIPLLYESQSIDMFDKVWVVKSTYEKRLSRVMTRDGLSSSFTSRIILSQIEEDNCEKIADVVINNDKDIESIKPLIKSLWDELNSNENNSAL